MADEKPKGGPGRPKNSEKGGRGAHLRKENRDENGKIKPKESAADTKGKKNTKN